MRTNYLLLGLVALTAVIGLALSGSPDQADGLARMRDGVAFTGEAREIALGVLALGLAGFIAYLAITRR